MKKIVKLCMGAAIIAVFVQIVGGKSEILEELNKKEVDNALFDSFR
ncbi:MAG: hypothetical protein PHG06_13895 [Parabacteroides sp.]|nr:hypothetical protein [Parabacteroides sp.]